MENSMSVDAAVGEDQAAVVIRVDRDRCAAAGLCVLFEPDFFDQSETDGRVLPRVREAGPEALPALQEAAARCPAEAITVMAPVRRERHTQVPD